MKLLYHGSSLCLRTACGHKCRNARDVHLKPPTCQHDYYASSSELDIGSDWQSVHMRIIVQLNVNDLKGTFKEVV